MTTYRMDDGIVVDTNKASDTWEEKCDWDGRNFISRATGSQWEHETLYRSRKGRYYLESSSQYQGTRPSAYWIEPEAAASWLLAMERELPADLLQYADELSE